MTSGGTCAAAAPTSRMTASVTGRILCGVGNLFIYPSGEGVVGPTSNRPTGISTPLQGPQHNAKPAPSKNVCNFIWSQELVGGRGLPWPGQIVLGASPQERFRSGDQLNQVRSRFTIHPRARTLGVACVLTPRCVRTDQVPSCFCRRTASRVVLSETRNSVGD